jgi:hypothetical protein
MVSTVQRKARPAVRVINMTSTPAAALMGASLDTGHQNALKVSSHFAVGNKCQKNYFLRDIEVQYSTKRDKCTRFQ